MAKVSVSEAARLVKKSRSLLYTKRDNCELSFEKDHTGKTVIETSELVRVFGEISGVQVSVKSDDSIEHSSTVEKTQKTDTVSREIELMQQLLNEKDKRIEDLQNTIKLIEYKSEKTDDSQGFFARLFT